MNYNHLRYFHVVSETGSLTAAARDLGVTVSTVSEQIKQLETALGHRLFDRTGAGLRPTEVGRVAQQHTAVMFREGERLLERLDAIDRPDRQLHEVGVSTSVSRSLAADRFLPLYRMESVFVRLRSSDEPGLLRSLAMHELDLIVTDQPIADAAAQGIETEVLDHPTMVAVADAELAETIETFPHGLGRAPMVHYPRASRPRFEIDRFLREHGVFPHVVGEVSDLGVMRALAVQGVAAAVLPRSATDDRLSVLGELPDCRHVVLAAYKSEDPGDFVRAAVEALKRALPVAGSRDGAA